MNALIQHPYQKRFFLAMLIVATLAYLFWTGSRYPALDEKAMMSGAIQLEDPLEFEALFPLTVDMGTLERIFFTTINWINTNKKGMTFGVMFAAAFLTAAGYLKQRSFRGGFANSLLGLAIGTPLGVCVNCAAPIARGMYSAGMRAETTLSAMIASPTLNIVVLTMLFSLLPFYMAVAKIALSLAVILIAVPLICRLLPQTEIAPSDLQEATPWSVDELSQGNPVTDPLGTAILAVGQGFLKNLWYIVKMTVPLMLLAGFLGALVAVLLPQELITELPFGVVALIVIVTVGLFLPVPIAFDVVVTGALLSAGLAHGYVMGLLFTLGIFSVYSCLIVVQSVGTRAAWMLSATIAVLGVVAGLGAQEYHDWQSRRALEMLLESLVPDALPPMWSAAASEASSITVTSTALAPQTPVADHPFTRFEADTIGIGKPVEFSFRDMWPPFWEGRSLSSADFDRDGDLDLAIASTEVGLYLYANDGSGQFAPSSAALGDLTTAPIFNAVFADIDNDGWPDLFLTTYLQGNYWWRNVEGKFGSEPPEPVPNNPQTPLSLAVALADVDANGTLDVALGNWAAGWYRRIPGEESRNRLILNTDGALTGETYADMPGIPGETLTILFSDFDDDGATDLIVGNDFDIPDYFYRGDGKGGFAMLTQPQGLIPHTTTTTMAIKTADLANDGTTDIYLAQIAGRSSGVSDTLKMQPLGQYCDGIQNADAKDRCQQNMDIKSWYKSGNNFDPTYAKNCQKLTGRDQVECKAMLVKDLAIQKRDPSICELIRADQPIPRAYCDWHFKPTRSPTAEEISLTHRQILRSNVMLARTGEGWEDVAEYRGLDVGGWSWDTKIADFDLDGWQDVYIVNGTWVPNEVSPSNLFFHNRGDGTFAEASGPFGLEDYLMTASATQMDFDNDGDLDLITHPVNGPLVAFRNNAQGAAVVFQLEDHIGNRDGIGARVTLTGVDGTAQMRELQLGGGFMSFDAPRAHFGLGDQTEATDASVTWADGSTSFLKGPFQAGHIYTVARHP